MFTKKCYLYAILIFLSAAAANTYAANLAATINNGAGGTFSLNSAVTYYGGVTITGNTVINGNGANIVLNGSLPYISVSGSARLEVYNCHFTNGDRAIYYASNSTGIVSGCTIDGSSTYSGLDIVGNANVTITNSTIRNKPTGIYLSSNGRATVTGSTITQNTFGSTVDGNARISISSSTISSNQYAFMLLNYSTASIDACQISSNTNSGILGYSYSTLNLNNSTLSSDGTEITLLNNAQATISGTYIMSGQNGCNFGDNSVGTFSYCSITGFSNAGIIATGYASVTISNVYFASNLYSITITDNVQSSITNNTFDGGTYGISASSSSSINTLSDNTISSCTQTGIVVMNTAFCNITHNNINYNNTGIQFNGCNASSSVRYNTFLDNVAGIIIEAASPLVTYNHIENNAASYMGGISCYNGCNSIVTHNYVKGHLTGIGVSQYSNPIIMYNEVCYSRYSTLYDLGTAVYAMYYSYPYIAYNYLHDNQGDGMYFEQCASATIEWNIIQRNEDNGIFSNDIYDISQQKDNLTIKNNYITNSNHCGISVPHTNAFIYNNTILDSNIAGLLCHEEQTDPSPSVISAYYNIIINDNVTVLPTNGLHVTYSYPVLISNIISKFTQKGVASYSASPYLVNNVITENTGNGVYIDNSNGTYTQNYIINNTYGDPNSSYNVFSNGTSNPVVTYNTIYSNNGQNLGARSWANSYTWNATNNYWGSATGPSGEGSGSGSSVYSVLYSPFLTYSPINNVLNKTVTFSAYTPTTFDFSYAAIPASVKLTTTQDVSNSILSASRYYGNMFSNPGLQTMYQFYDIYAAFNIYNNLLNAEITFTYSDGSVPGGYTESNLRVYKYNVESYLWEGIHTSVDTVNNTLTINTDELVGTYGLFFAASGTTPVSPTPTPVPTPPTTSLITNYGFDSTEEGWTYTSFAMQGEPTPVSAFYPGCLAIHSTSNVANYGFWRSNMDQIPYYPDSIYLLRFTYHGSTDASHSPEIRLRINNQAETAAGFINIGNWLDSSESPSTTPKMQTVIFEPPDLSPFQYNELLDDLYLSFDLLNFTSSGAPNAAVFLDNAEVDIIPNDSLQWDLVKVYDTTTDFSNWITYTYPAYFNSPLFSVGSGSLTITANGDSSNTYGGWMSNPTADEIDIAANTLYKAVYKVSSHSAQNNVPQLRMRIQSESCKLIYGAIVFSNLDGDNSPTPEGKEYSTYLIPSQTDIGTDNLTDGILICFDFLNFEPTDDPNGDLTLERVAVMSTDASAVLP